MATVPVIDIFAGPGGLGEGFSRLVIEQEHVFQIALSIEKDYYAHQTLELRSFFRQFSDGQVPDEYYDYLRGKITRSDLFKAFPAEAKTAREDAWLHTLEEATHAETSERISRALKKNGVSNNVWVLIGGPPCQAYSVIGRSRMRGQDPDEFELDHRHFLYREYLRILADHGPAVFVMENVPGLLSSMMKKSRIFDQIRRDLASPSLALGRALTDESSSNHTYSIVPIAVQREEPTNVDFEPTDFLVESEKYGIPQTRHRVILLGIRNDLLSQKATYRPPPLTPRELVGARRVLDDLPPLRSGLTPRDSYSAWSRAVASFATQTSKRARFKEHLKVKRTLDETREIVPVSRGAGFIPSATSSSYRGDWYGDAKLDGVLNHETRVHMREDLHRYFYASYFAKVTGRSPKLRDFPDILLPDHANVDDGVNGHLFSDRFRVQVESLPATTVTSHISHDGHYYIHYDPYQCRSLTVREAARLQTFPDNYFFEGPRTRQYVQVGNAVPPLLAYQIAEVVADAVANLCWPPDEIPEKSLESDKECNLNVSMSSH